jgi:two-component system sensor kinase FixL
MILEMDFMVGLLTRDAGVTVLYDVSIADGPVIADSVQIQQVVLNLVRNAVEAMHGSADRRLEISSRLENEVWIVAVEDSGPGLKKETEAGLFIGSGIGQGAGLGMGLSICKTIVEHHGGRIWAGRSRWGGGAFSFSLPRAAHAT